MKFLAFVLCAVLAGQAWAEDRRLAPGIRVNVTDAQFVQAVEDAFINRNWTVVSVGDKSVTGELQHRGLSSRLVFQRKGERLYYVDSTRQLESDNGDEVRVPERWLKNLIADIRRQMIRAERLEDANYTKDELRFRKRLDNLQRMLDEGTINEAEYKTMRANLVENYR